jgi:glycosyltransferase involved in cell wall biosynthesis
MRICLGILAYNEERNIARTLEDILCQDIWENGLFTGRLHVVVNGSRDRTAEIAREVLESFSGTVSSEVHELTRAGKANAWNEFVHRLSEPDTDLFFFADADIRLPQADALTRMAQTLMDCPKAVACVDIPRKDFSGVRMNALERRLSGSASELAVKGPPKLCGQLYTARAEALRSFWLPEPLLVEDGLIKAMLVTRNFSEPECLDRLVRADGVYHLYQPEVGLKNFYRHEKRILIGSLCNFRLFDLLRGVVEQGGDAGNWLKDKQSTDPDWFRRELEESFSRPGSRRELRKMIFAPLTALKHVTGFAKLKAFPAAVIRFLLTFWVGLGTARDLRRKRFVW